ncbi:MAG: TrlF family AAA-like ATPase [Pseudomonadota bacterium]
MSEQRGSAWRKWDLHVHTPDSLVQQYGAGPDVWDRFIEELSKLPPEFKVLGINDYIFLDGYKKVADAKAAGMLPNIELLLPVMEFRLDKFGGTKSGLSRVNYHVIFSDEIKPEIIQSQFLSALCSKYVLTPEFDSLRTTGRWAAVPTRQSVEDLGRLIIDSVPEAERSKFHAPIIEGFNNLCLSLSAIQEALNSPYFVGKTLTAVGKTEWADIKWNDHSIADKKSIINSADLVFISSATGSEFTHARDSLTRGGVNDRLLDCSDAHRWPESKDKDRLGKCLTWIKADPTFEGLRQAVFEYSSRVFVSETPPIAPLLQIRRVTLDFSPETSLSNGERSDVFCFRGKHEIAFSPHLTCIIGGRGTGKSTLLNLLHEKLDFGSSELFRKNRLTPEGTTVAAGVAIDGITERGVVEFLQQNEIEQFASDHQRLTAAIFVRLAKLDSSNVLQAKEVAIDAAKAATQKQLERMKAHYEVSQKLINSRKELATQKSIVESFQNTDYRQLNDALGALNKELQGLRTSKDRLERLLQALNSVLVEFSSQENQVAVVDAYEQEVRRVTEVLRQTITSAVQYQALAATNDRELELSARATALRKELDEFLRARGLSNENLSDLGRATERIAQLEESIGALEGKVESLKSELGEFKPQRKAIEDYEQAVQEILSPVNAKLQIQGEQVKPIELRYRFDGEAFKDSMIQYVAKAIGTIDGRGPRPDYIEAKLGKLDFTSLTDRAAAVGHIPSEDGVYARALREFLGGETNFEILKLEAEQRLLDIRTLRQMSVLYDNKPVENTSFGQRCTAVIVVLLLLGNMPVVIHEPEAHLDSALIAKYLVDLIKSTKLNRQIIFATHNANLVINGDAELVHCMSMDDKKVSSIVSTTIEDVSHRELLLSLEGGERAFQQRERRYGID